MKLDYTKNPLGIVKEFILPYDNNKQYLEARIHGIMEEGFDEVTFFRVSVVYPYTRERGTVEMIDELNDYKELKRAVPTLIEAEARLIRWCREAGLSISILSA
jgi:hypothetical protein